MLLAWCAAAHAYRPFESTDASVVDVGVVEIELGPVAYVDESDGSTMQAPVLTLNAGISPDWELVIDATRAVTRSSTTRNVETLETAALLKGMLRNGALQQNSGWSVATEFGMLLPTRNADDDYGATLSVIGSFESQQTVLHLNGGVARNRSGNMELFSGVILEGTGAAAVRPVAEVTFEFEDGSSNRIVSTLLGAIWRRSDRLSFDIAARAIHEADAWSYEGRIGLTWSFALART